MPESRVKGVDINYLQLLQKKVGVILVRLQISLFIRRAKKSFFASNHGYNQREKRLARVRSMTERIFMPYSPSNTGMKNQIGSRYASFALLEKKVFSFMKELSRNCI